MNHRDDKNQYHRGWRATNAPIRRRTELFDALIEHKGDIEAALKSLIMPEHDVDMHRFKLGRAGYQEVVNELARNGHPIWAQKLCDFVRGGVDGKSPLCADAALVTVPPVLKTIIEKF